MAAQGVFHRQIMQIELGGHGGQLGLARPVEADPRHTPVPAQFAERLLQAFRGGGTDAVNVDAVIDQHHCLQRHLVVIRNPAMAMPKPIMMFQDPAAGSGQAPWVM